MPMSAYNRTISQVAVAQGGAGSTDIVAAPGTGVKIYVVSWIFTISAAGTLKFQEGGTTDLTGAFDVAASGGFVVGSANSEPVLSTLTANSKLNIVSTVGLVKGVVRYFIDV